MNCKIRIILSSLVVLTLLFYPFIPAKAKTIRTQFSGSEVFLEDVDSGREFITKPGRYQLRDGRSRFEITTTDPRLNGENLVTVNLNFKLVDPPVFGTGPMWGKFRISNAGGAWEGSWNGVRDENGYSYFRFVGKGLGGYAGMKLQMWAERLTPDPTQPEMLHGYIIEGTG
jgi:hypothetical protein